jgi:hypothetical protein
MDQKRILQLAFEALEIQKAEIDAEIETLRAELEGTGSGAPRKAKPVVIPIGRRRTRTLAENRAHAERMRRYWAAKRAQTSATKKTSPASAKGRPKSAAEKKVLSLKMKQVWAKKRAEAAKTANR